MSTVVRRRAGGSDVALHLAEQLAHSSDAAGALQAVSSGAALAELHARAWLAAHPVWLAGAALLVGYALWHVTRAAWRFQAL